MRRWKMGVIVRARGGPCAGLCATVPVPTDWPEQQVKVVDEAMSPQVARIRYRTLEGGVKQMVVTIPKLAAHETAEAVVTFEVVKSAISAPADPGVFRTPKRPPRDVGEHLLPSPYIESGDRRIRSLAKEITAGKEGAWRQVEAVFDWVRANVRYEFDAELKGAITALREGKGDCEELTSLFVALCRAHGIPARSVWVPGHCYPEFYLEDEEGRGHWFPCQAAGAPRQFGAMSESRPILQKGDRFRVPGLRAPQRYVQVMLTAQRAAAAPEVEWVKEMLED
jgi:hypothetical protein